MQIGRNIIHLSSVDSTNNYIANAISEGIIESGAVILADEQYNGRGQRGNKWQSDPGSNLTFSFYLDNVNLSVENQFNMNIWVSICIIRALGKLGIEAKIKWPNDIYVGEKKIAGILIENSLSGHSIRQSIVGVGLNINQTSFGDLSATSLSILKNEKLNLKETLFSLIHELNQVSHHNQLKDEYLDHLYRVNRISTFEDDQGIFDGLIRGVSDDGKILIEVDKTMRSYYFKEVKFIS